MITDQDVDEYIWLMEQEQLALNEQIEDMEQAEPLSIFPQVYQPNLNFNIGEKEE